MRTVAVICGVGAALTAGYLTYVAIIAKGLPVGCGAGSGCSEVLRSRWSAFLGLPVSLLGCVSYLALAGGVLATPSGARAPAWLHAVGGMVLGAAVWFVVLQIAVIRSICPWCMADHCLGGLAALIVLFRFGSPNWRAAAGGLLPVIALTAAQMLAPAPRAQVARLPAGVNADTGPGPDRAISVADGSVALQVDDELLIGSPDAETMLVMLMDYACPHCRRTHGHLDVIMAGEPGRWAVVLLPSPLNATCNPHMAETAARFKDSCELTKLAMGVNRADRNRYPEFDAWLFEPETPRTAADARTRAAELVGEDALARAMNLDVTERRIARNTELYGTLEHGTLPVILSPQLDTIIGRSESAEDLLALLNQQTAHASNEEGMGP